MPGIIVYKGKKDISTTNLINRIQHRHEQKTFYFSGTYDKDNVFLSVTTINSMKFPKKYFFFEGKHKIVLLYGNAFRMSGNQKRLSAENIYSINEKYDKNFIKHIDGDFSIVIFNKRTAEISTYSDRWALRPLYFHDKYPFFISSEIKPFYEIEDDLDEDFLFLFLNLKRTLPGNRTILKNVKKLYPGYTYSSKIYGSTFIPESYWNSYPIIKNKKITKNKIKDILVQYKNILNNQVNGFSHFGLSLSGGIDSRFLLAGLSKNNRKKLLSYNYAVSDSEENLLAHQVAKKADVQFLSYSLTPEDFLNNAFAASYLTDGMDLFIQGAALNTYRQLPKTVATTLHGLGMEVFLGGRVLNKKVLKFSSHKELLNYQLNKHLLLDKTLINKLFKTKIQNKSIIKIIKESFNESFAKCRSKNLILKHEERIFNDRLLSAHSLRRNIQRNFQEDIFPAFSTPFLQNILSIDYKQRIDNNLYCALYKQLDPKLFSLIYHRTLLPADVPQKYFKQAHEIKNLHENLYRKIYFETTGSSKPYYNHHYANFDAFTYMNNAWKKFISELLFSKNTILGKYVNINILKKQVEDHWKGKNNFYWPILVFCSAELMLRQHSNRFSKKPQL
jgi:asparagine synthase (glutamine-hydrolysing)